MSRSDHSSKREAIRRSFMARPKLCIHALHEMTEIDYPDIESILTELINEGMITHYPNTSLGDDDHQYLYTGSRKLSHELFPVFKSSPLVGLDETEMRNRVVMLERMRRLLICEWHPIIDVIINDYKRDLQRIDVLRYGEDEDSSTQPQQET